MRIDNMNAALMTPPERDRGFLEKISGFVMSAMPILIIAALIYAAFFVKPQAKGASTERPVIEKRDRFYGAVVPDQNVIWAAGNYGKIVRSNDGGSNWSSQVSGTNQHFQSIAAWDRGNAIAVGNGGAVVITQDSGQNWKALELPASAAGKKLIRVRADKNGHAWIVGEIGTLISVINFGASVVDQSSGGDVTWNDVAQIGNRVCTVGEFGRIRCSNDQGHEWIDATSPVNSSLNSIAFRNESSGVAVGLEGNIVITNDGGAHWHVLSKVTEQHLYSVTWDGHRWLAVGAKGVTLSADVQGEPWKPVKGDGTNTVWHTEVVGTGEQIISVGQGISVAELNANER